MKTVLQRLGDFGPTCTISEFETEYRNILNLAIKKIPGAEMMLVSVDTGICYVYGTPEPVQPTLATA